MINGAAVIVTSVTVLKSTNLVGNAWCTWSKKQPTQCPPAALGPAIHVMFNLSMGMHSNTFVSTETNNPSWSRMEVY